MEDCSLILSSLEIREVCVETTVALPALSRPLVITVRTLQKGEGGVRVKERLKRDRLDVVGEVLMIQR